MSHPREPVVLSWSGGKDSALALHALRDHPRHRVVGLLSTVQAEDGRVGMHGVRRALLERQAEAAGLPLRVVEVPASPSNDEYGARMAAALEAVRAAGIRTVAFGDLLLEDVRRYRESMLATVGMTALFPLWGSDTAALARRFVDDGFRAVVVCVDAEQIDPALAGRDLDRRFLADLPPEADPCGENGEYHSFVWDGPVLAAPVRFRRGCCALHDGRFQRCDLIEE